MPTVSMSGTGGREGSGDTHVPYFPRLRKNGLGKLDSLLMVDHHVDHKEVSLERTCSDGWLAPRITTESLLHLYGF